MDVEVGLESDSSSVHLECLVLAPSGRRVDVGSSGEHRTFLKGEEFPGLTLSGPSRSAKSFDV
jgi:hypothetical protein